MYKYQDPSTTMTLAQGLEEYYAANPDFVGNDGFLAQDEATIKSHDVAHVFFGLGPSSAEELLVEVMTILGCSYTAQDATSILKKGFVGKVVGHFGVWRLLKRLFTTFPRVARAAYRAFRMKQKWPHLDYETHMQTSLVQLRAEFGIKVGL